MKTFLIGYHTFLDWLERASLLFAMVLTALLFLNTASGIVADRVTGNSLVWVEELNNLFFAWAVFVGAGVIARHGGHIGVDMVYELLGPRMKTLFRVIYMIMALIIVWVMVYYGVKMALFVGKYQTSLYLDISLFYYYFSIPVGGALLGFFSIGAALPDPRGAPPVMQFSGG